MKYFVLAGALACALCAGAFGAEEDIKGKSTDSASQTVVFEEAGGSGEREIDSGRPRRTAYPNDGGVAGTMPSDESYDENTGLPDYVPSDTAGEFD